MTAQGPCQCWHPGPVFLHEGHCCFRESYDRAANVVTCGYDDAGMAIIAAWPDEAIA